MFSAVSSVKMSYRLVISIVNTEVVCTISYFIPYTILYKFPFSSSAKVANRLADILLVLTVFKYSCVVIFATRAAKHNQLFCGP